MMMGRYHVYCADREMADECFEADDDLEALELARLRLIPIDCELWCGSRLVVILPAHGSMVPLRQM